eukprot:scaffold72176_cov68-Phaeocystis_antarctica.AAC.6
MRAVRGAHGGRCAARARSGNSRPPLGGVYSTCMCMCMCMSCACARMCMLLHSPPTCTKKPMFPGPSWNMSWLGWISTLARPTPASSPPSPPSPPPSPRAQAQHCVQTEGAARDGLPRVAGLVLRRVAGLVVRRRAARVSSIVWRSVKTALCARNWLAINLRSSPSPSVSRSCFSPSTSALDFASTFSRALSRREGSGAAASPPPSSPSCGLACPRLLSRLAPERTCTDKRLPRPLSPGESGGCGDVGIWAAAASPSGRERASLRALSLSGMRAYSSTRHCVALRPASQLRDSPTDRALRELIQLALGASQPTELLGALLDQQRLVSLDLARLQWVGDLPPDVGNGRLAIARLEPLHAQRECTSLVAQLVNCLRIELGHVDATRPAERRSLPVEQRPPGALLEHVLHHRLHVLRRFNLRPATNVLKGSATLQPHPRTDALGSHRHDSGCAGGRPLRYPHDLVAVDLPLFVDGDLDSPPHVVPGESHRHLAHEELASGAQWLEALVLAEAEAEESGRHSERAEGDELVQQHRPEGMVRAGRLVEPLVAHALEAGPEEEEQIQLAQQHREGAAQRLRARAVVPRQQEEGRAQVVLEEEPEEDQRQQPMRERGKHRQIDGDDERPAGGAEAAQHVSQLGPRGEGRRELEVAQIERERAAAALEERRLGEGGEGREVRAAARDGAGRAVLGGNLRDDLAAVGCPRPLVLGVVTALELCVALGAEPAIVTGAAAVVTGAVARAGSLDGRARGGGRRQRRVYRR